MIDKHQIPPTVPTGMLTGINIKFQEHFMGIYTMGIVSLIISALMEAGTDSKHWPAILYLQRTPKKGSLHKIQLMEGSAELNPL